MPLDFILPNHSHLFPSSFGLPFGCRFSRGNFEAFTGELVCEEQNKISLYAHVSPPNPNKEYASKKIHICEGGKEVANRRQNVEASPLLDLDAEGC